MSATKPEESAAAEQGASGASERWGMVVGVDGSPGAVHALAWAAARTDRFGPIRPIAAWQYPTWALSDPMLSARPPVAPEQFEDAAREEAEEAIATSKVDSYRPLLVAESSPGPALVEYGANANLIVVGTRGRGAIADNLLGSVSCYAVAHASTAVAVVPLAAPLEVRHGRVVVGVDGSANSVEALRWAVRTTPPDVAIEAVHVWSHRAAAIPEPYSLPVEYTETNAKRTMERVVADVEPGAGQGREIVERLEYGDPRSVLRSLSEDADLLVLGGRGHRGVAHLLVGSVTSGLVHQPLVTTVVVPAGIQH